MLCWQKFIFILRLQYWMKHFSSTAIQNLTCLAKQKCSAKGFWNLSLIMSYTQIFWLIMLQSLTIFWAVCWHLHLETTPDTQICSGLYSFNLSPKYWQIKVSVSTLSHTYNSSVWEIWKTNPHRYSNPCSSLHLPLQTTKETVCPKM